MEKAKKLTMSLLLLLSGCWPRSYDLVQNGVLCVDLKAPKDIPIRALSVTQDEDVLVVEGVIGSMTPPRSVSVSLLAPEGKVLSEATVLTRRSTRRSPSRRHFAARLEAGQGIELPKGSTLRIAY